MFQPLDKITVIKNNSAVTSLGKHLILPLIVDSSSLVQSIGWGTANSSDVKTNNNMKILRTMNIRMCCQAALMAILLAMPLCSRAALSVTGSQSGQSFPIISTSTATSILYDSNDAPVVGTAAKMLNSDIYAVTGKKLSVVTANVATEYAIIAGTVDSSAYIKQLSDAGKIDVSKVKGKWEAFSIQKVDHPLDGITQALVICGSDPRGTAYGLLELSRLMGVSPYIWWADVVPTHQSQVFIDGDGMFCDSPSVQYRGIFINDEDWGILPWARKGIDKKYNNLAVNTYEKIADLMLRLRANILWPCNHGSSRAFWTLQGNLDVARNYGIVLGGGTMLRETLWEWPRYGQSSSDYNYATNRDVMLKYWAERVGQSRGYEAIYNISSRGFQDAPLLGYDNTADAVKGITGMIADQRKLIQDSLGDPTTIPQLYMPYKEALDLYNAGLQIPDDVILCWVDDNFGHIRQTPNATEQARSGGNGIYYHLSYLGTPAPYLWLSSMSPAFISYELTKGYDNGIKKFWMFNVGDIKPAEEELEFCMDLAWDINSWQPQDAHKYSQYWAGKTFGKDVADEIGSIKNEYYALASACKPELINRMDFTDTEYNERVARYQKLIDRVEAVKSKIPAKNQDAFFELVEYPVEGAANMNIKIIRAKQSWLYAAAGIADSALAFGKASNESYSKIKAATKKYNEEIANGKWNGIMNDKPYGGSVFDEPSVPTESDIFSVREHVEDPQRTYYLAKNYVSGNGNLTVVEGMGVAGSSVIVSPLDMKKYNAANYKSASSMNFNVKVKAGLNHIVVRCLPTFPINTSRNLRIGVVLNNSTKLNLVSLKTTAMSGKWNTTVAQDFNDATLPFTADKDEEIPVKVVFMDPGLAVSDLYVESEDIPDDSLTDKLLVNADFELNADSVHKGATGIPYGWKMNVLPTGGSYGVNADGENPHGEFCCWVIARPFPDDFMLYQTIPADKLEPGVYRVSCILWNQNGISGACRLFANKSVQYFASVDGVKNKLTDGEINYYASHQGTTTSDATMKFMSVYVIVNKGDSLQLGIRTSNNKGDGKKATGNDPTGWFKVDHFRIEKMPDTTNGIGAVKMRKEVADDRIYSLNGVLMGRGAAVRQRLPKGIYISNGRKIVIR